jgi:hypothetical protein
VTTISISDRATTPDEVIAELRKVASFIEELANIGAAKVTITGELNLTVDYRQSEPEDPDWKKAPDWDKVAAS